MTRRLIQEEDVRSILKVRRSYYISLPIQLIREFKWRESQKVVVEKRGKEIVIKDWPVRQAQGKKK